MIMTAQDLVPCLIIALVVSLMAAVVWLGNNLAVEIKQKRAINTEKYQITHYGEATEFYTPDGVRCIYVSRAGIDCDFVQKHGSK